MSANDAASVIAMRWQGMKVAALGAALAGVGFLLAWVFDFQPGLIVFFVGWVVAASGGFIHIRQMLRETRLKQGDLHPRAPQPWEK